MPGRLFLRRPVAHVARHLGARPVDGADLGPRTDIAPRDPLLVAAPDGTLRPMRWGIVPVGRVNARGRPVMELIVNARGETVFAKSAYEGVRRGLVPACGWYEWTGPARRKTRWRIRPRGGDLVVFAAIWDLWRGGGGATLEQAAIVTTEPSLDVREVHDRMGVILEPGDFATWLGGDADVACDLIRPAPDGSLIVERAAET